MSNGGVHEYEPDMLPDSCFEPGALRHLVPGNRGRMLDRRRTPVRIVSLRPEIGTWTCQVLAFEDRGARWELPLESVIHYQFALGSVEADESALRALRAAVERFDRRLEIVCDPERRARTLARIGELRREASSWLAAESEFFASGGTLDPGAREGDPRLQGDLRRYLDQRDLWPIEQEFAAGYASHPGSGERVKGHLIVLAELGLTAYRGTVVRDPATFEGAWSREARERHALARMAFTQAALAAGGLGAPVLHRALSSEGPIAARTPEGLVSSTFSLEVALSFLGPPGEPRHAILCRQPVALERIFMTFFETEALNRPFREAEAVLIADPANSLF